MNAGLEAILAKIIREPTNSILLNRFLVLIAELRDSNTKINLLIRLGNNLIQADPLLAMSLGCQTFEESLDLNDHRAKNYAIDSLKLIASSLKERGSLKKAKILEREMTRIKGRLIKSNGSKPISQEIGNFSLPLILGTLDHQLLNLPQIENPKKKATKNPNDANSPIFKIKKSSLRKNNTKRPQLPDPIPTQADEPNLDLPIDLPSIAELQRESDQNLEVPFSNDEKTSTDMMHEMEDTVVNQKIDEDFSIDDSDDLYTDNRQTETNPKSLNRETPQHNRTEISDNYQNIAKIIDREKSRDDTKVIDESLSPFPPLQEGNDNENLKKKEPTHYEGTKIKIAPLDGFIPSSSNSTDNATPMGQPAQAQKSSENLKIVSNTMTDSPQSQFKKITNKLNSEETEQQFLRKESALLLNLCQLYLSQGMIKEADQLVHQLRPGIDPYFSEHFTNLKKRTVAIKSFYLNKIRPAYIKDPFPNLFWTQLANHLNQNFKAYHPKPPISLTFWTSQCQDILPWLQLDHPDNLAKQHISMHIWRSLPQQDVSNLLKTIAFQQIEHQFWLYYIDLLMEQGRSRKALFEIIDMNLHRKDLTWVQESWIRLQIIWKNLHTVGFAWEESMGIDDFIKKLKIRPRPTLKSIGV